MAKMTQDQRYYLERRLRDITNTKLDKFRNNQTKLPPRLDAEKLKNEAMDEAIAKLSISGGELITLFTTHGQYITRTNLVEKYPSVKRAIDAAAKKIEAAQKEFAAFQQERNKEWEDYNKKITVQTKGILDMLYLGDNAGILDALKKFEEEV